MTDPNTPRSMFVAENGNVTHVGWLANLYTDVEDYDDASGRVDYVIRVDFVEERARRPVLTGTATVEELADLTIDLLSAIVLYLRRLEWGRPAPNLHAVDVRDDWAKALRPLGLDEHSPEVRELMDEMAPERARAQEELREWIDE
ncbi:MAG: hypothetical protein ABJF88_11150 [Rhodothermales bacterium]